MCCGTRCRGRSCRAVEGWPSGQTCWRRFQSGSVPVSGSGCWRGCRSCLSGRGLSDWSRVIVDASLVDAKKGAARSRRSLRGRSGSRFHLAVDAAGAPFAIRIGPGNENERLHLCRWLTSCSLAASCPLSSGQTAATTATSCASHCAQRGVEPMISERRRPGEPDPGRHTDRPPREPSPTQTTRPARTQTLAGRTHQQLATQLAARRDPLGTPTRTLARRHPNRRRHHHLPNPRTLIPLAPPDTFTKTGVRHLYKRRCQTPRSRV